MRKATWTARLALPAGLVVLVAVLAVLQYRWLGQVSGAERDRLQASLTQRAAEFADDFDRELLRIYLGLQTDGPTLRAGDAEPFARRYDAWREAARDPQILRAVYLTSLDGPASSLSRYDPDARRFTPVDWPRSLAPVRDTLSASVESTPDAGERRVFTVRRAVLPSIPALTIALPTVRTTVGAAPAATGPAAAAALFATRVVPVFLIAELDRDRLTSSFLPTLADRYFPPRDRDAYRFAIIESDGGSVVYARGGPEAERLDPRHADANVPLFALRFDLSTQIMVRALDTIEWKATSADTDRAATNGGAGATAGPMAGPSVGGRGGRGASQSLSIVVQGSGDRGQGYVIEGQPASAWRLVLQHAAGSLDAAVTATRRRNLWLSFGILGVLAAGVALVAANAQRSLRLAAQQMDFVATVSHELRTPLAVMRSAAQNLAAGVVSDPGRARQYGELIESEGRQLTDMVEQVLEFAGLGSDRPGRPDSPVDIGEVVQEAVHGCEQLRETADCEIDVEIATNLPAVSGDAPGIRRAVHNLVANALKHAGGGGWVGVRAGVAADRREIRISVTDRGPGIDAEDLPHVFEPFYRGRQAMSRQVHGNGLGLSLVQRIAETHGGRATAEAPAGGGAVFTLHLPAGAGRRAEARPRSAEPEPGPSTT